MARSVVPVPRAGEDPTARPRVVVGVDGSAASTRALVWGLEFADAYGAAVEIVTAWPLHAPVFIGEVPGHFNDARWQAVAAQRLSVEQADLLVTVDVPRTRRVENAGPLQALVSAARGAALVVVGAARDFPTDDPPGPTLAEALQAAARCPVLEVSSFGVVSLPWGDHAFPAGPSGRSARRVAAPAEA